MWLQATHKPPVELQSWGRGGLSALWGLNAPYIACRVSTWGPDALSQPESAAAAATKHQSRALGLKWNHEPQCSHLKSSPTLWISSVSLLLQNDRKSDKIDSHPKCCKNKPAGKTTLCCAPSCFVFIFFWLKRLQHSDQLLVFSPQILLVKLNRNNGLICVDIKSMRQFCRMLLAALQSHLYSKVPWNDRQALTSAEFQVFQCFNCFPSLSFNAHNFERLSIFCFRELTLKMAPQLLDLHRDSQAEICHVHIQKKKEEIICSIP